MIVRCQICRKVRIDPNSVMLVKDDDVVAEGWADPIESNHESKVYWARCPFCEEERRPQSQKGKVSCDG